MKTIIFLGTPQMSADLLEEIIKDNKYKVVGVISQPDKPLGRKKILTPSPVSMVALKYNIPLHRPEKLNNDYEFIERLQPDLLLTFAYGQLISTKVLSLSKYQALNLHGSLLPKYRGAAPIQYALKNGDKKTGVCLMAMVKKMDAGAVYGKVEISIDEEDNYTSLCKKITEASHICMNRYLPDFFENKIIPLEQNEEEVTFSPSIKPEEEHLDLQKSSEEFLNQIRSLSETPCGYLYLESGEKFKIYKAHYLNVLVESEVGKIIVAHKKDLIIQLKDGQINLDIVQKSGKNKMDSQSFNNGTAFLGSVLK